MFWTCPTAPAAGRTIDPILTAYLVAAGAPMLLAGLIWGLRCLLGSPGPVEPDAPRPMPPPQCPRCGYDVRATPDGSARFGRCPECGGSVEAGSVIGAEARTEAGER